jgi:hypothetical protein
MILHRDHEDLPSVVIVSIVSIVSPVVGMGGEPSPRQRRSESQCTRGHMMSQLEHGATSNERMSGVGRCRLVKVVDRLDGSVSEARRTGNFCPDSADAHRFFANSEIAERDTRFWLLFGVSSVSTFG